MTELKAQGVRRTVLARLSALKDRPMAGGVLLDQETLTLLGDLTNTLNREILLTLDDHNVIRHVGLGDHASVALSAADAQGRSAGLRRRRVIHTHPGGSPHLSEEDLSAARRGRLQCMIAVGCSPEGPVRFGAALPMVVEGALTYRYALIPSLERLNAIDLGAWAARVSRELRRLPDASLTTAVVRERALLMGVDTGTDDKGIDLDSSMTELSRLVETAGGTPCGRITQGRPRPDPVTYLGRGKLAEAVRLVQNGDIDLIVANDELNTNQIACIEKVTGCKTIDRTTLILDIFARHAKTSEGKLQVELAQQKYRLAHLKGLGLVLSRTGGGIGTRGPGEKQLETDRRHIRRAINELTARLSRIDRANALGAKRRLRSGVHTVALVGYTNSGKSTLFNRLTDSDAVMADGLFITLDSTIRKLGGDAEGILLSDTVGFIEKLPHDLVTSFRTTLKEVEQADLLLHIADASSPNVRSQIAVVTRVLSKIGSARQDCLLVYNKVDALPEAEARVLRERAEDEGALCISAKTGEGIEALLDAVQKHLAGSLFTRTYLIPYDQSRTLSELYARAEVLATDYDPAGTRVTARIGRDFPAHRFEAYETEDTDHAQ